MPDDTTTKLPLRSRRDRKAAGSNEHKTRCECGREMSLRTGTHGARAGCDRCNALDARRDHQTHKGQRRTDRHLYGIRAAVITANRKFGESRFLPEPPCSSDSLPPEL